VRLVILVNAMNLLDLTTTVIGLRMGFVEWNVLMYNPLMLYVVKPLAVLVWSLVLYKVSMHKHRLVAKTARAMLVFLAVAFLVAVINNVLVILSVRY
jgi:hypothetical protein